jgi:hypothetical protein
VVGVRRAWGLGAVAAMAAFVGGCSSNPPPPAEEPKVEQSADTRPRKTGPAIEQEIGALDETKVKQTFQRVSMRLSSCYSKGAEKLAYLSGEVRFVIRVAKDGSARWAYVKSSSLGDREVEGCMLDALKNASWPKPEGGEGLAENSFTFEPSGDERPPVAWTEQNLGGAGRSAAKNALAQCKKKAGTKSLAATMYVETDGKPAAIGVSSGDEKGEAAVECVLSALKGLKFPSPGSYASKVTLEID